MQIDIKSLYKSTELVDGMKITVSAWVKTVRDSKKYGFIELNDGTFFKNLQAVCVEGETENFENAMKLTIGSAVEIEGNLVLTPEMQQPFELKAKNVKIIGLSDASYPLQKKRHSVEYLRTIAHLRPRTNLFTAVFRVRSVAAQLLHKFFAENNFVYVHTPIITSSDAEGAGEMFTATTLDMKNIAKLDDGNIDFSKDFFGKHTSLTVSGQLNVESFCMAFNKVYTFGPTFRAEKSNTPRHAAEFWMVEPEIAFADLSDNMDLAEELLKYVINGVIEQLPEEMDFLNKFVDKELINRLSKIAKQDFVRVSYNDAIDILKNSGVKFEYKVEWGVDLQTEHERYLTEQHFKCPVFVYNYPKDIKAFYMRLNDDGKTVAASDLLVPVIGELIGGSQREEREDVLINRMKELGMELEEYDWYVDTRRFGTFPHAGFGIGFERLIMYLTGVSNIRDVLPFPRTTGSAHY
ncbi:MAG: asparagine--tRNA ligase [Christensenellaceae bacterium]|nr:asparagine--tRNA ligase [Christensenellaceae bacterium]